MAANLHLLLKLQKEFKSANIKFKTNTTKQKLQPPAYQHTTH